MPRAFKVSIDRAGLPALAFATTAHRVSCQVATFYFEWSPSARLWQVRKEQNQHWRTPLDLVRHTNEHIPKYPRAACLPISAVSDFEWLGRVAANGTADVKSRDSRHISGFGGGAGTQHRSVRANRPREINVLFGRACRRHRVRCAPCRGRDKSNS